MPGLEVPFHRIRVRSDEPALADVERATDAALERSGIQLEPGREVAIAVGSRGLRDLRAIVARVVAWVQAQGGNPFLVPAMGSHGGATAAGQLAVLEGYGLGEAETGVPVRSSMEVVPLPAGDCPVPVERRRSLPLTGSSRGESGLRTLCFAGP